METSESSQQLSQTDNPNQTAEWFDKDDQQTEQQQEQNDSGQLPKDLAQLDIQDDNDNEDDGDQFKDAEDNQAAAPHEYDLEKAKKLKEQANEEFKYERYDESIRLYEEAIDLCPPEEFVDLAIFHNNKGICYTKLNQPKQAKKEFSRSIEVNANYVKPRAFRMKINRDEEEYDQALEDAKKIEELEPLYPGIHKTVKELDRLQKEKFEKMKNEVMGNLKNLGNSILGKFGMSLDAFKMNQNPDGTYNIQYQNQ